MPLEKNKLQYYKYIFLPALDPCVWPWVMCWAAWHTLC